MTQKGSMMKATEYGGSDTHKTLGIQPSPHVRDADEELRVFFHQAKDPNAIESAPVPGLGEN